MNFEVRAIHIFPFKIYFNDLPVIHALWWTEHAEKADQNILRLMLAYLFNSYYIIVVIVHDEGIEMNSEVHLAAG